MRPIRGVLFDLDGTLLDSAPDLVAALNHVRRSEDLDDLPVREMSPHASKGALGLLNAGMPSTDEDTLEKWRLRFLEHYAENSYRHSVLYEGVSEVLDYLQGRAIPWGIVTNKVESLTLPLVKAIGWKSTIGGVVCGDTLSCSKPEPEPVLLACRMLGVEASQVLFVGDDVRDVQAGLTAGTLTAAVLYGYGSGELTDSGIKAHMSLDRAAQLVERIEQWNCQASPLGMGHG